MRSPPSLLSIALGVLAVVIAIFTIPRLPSSLPRFGFGSRPVPIQTARTSLSASTQAHTMATTTTGTAQASPSEGQVYFLSHGGPPTMFEVDNPAYKAWQKYGRIVEQAKPRGLVVVSAHWEADRNGPGVVVNEDFSNPLVYDFYGFPKNYYEQKFESKGNSELLANVKASLKSAGVDFTTQKRGLDHGVWVPFLVAFKGKTDIPIIQVSLPGDSNPVSAAKLGRALASLREQGYAIMGTGQVVHNLRDAFQPGGLDRPYGNAFLDAAKKAVASNDPTSESINLFRHPFYRQAHPSPEHLLPLVVAAAATKKGDQVNEIFVKPAGAMSWGMWSWDNAQSRAPAAKA